jgi:hypothetical protein
MGLCKKDPQCVDYDFKTNHQVLSKGKIEITCSSDEYPFWDKLITRIHSELEQYHHEKITIEEFKKLIIEEIELSCQFLAKMPTKPGASEK